MKLIEISDATIKDIKQILAKQQIARNSLRIHGRIG